MKKRLLLVLLLFCTLYGSRNAIARAQPTSSRTATTSTAQAEGWLQHDRSGFVENKGQFSNQNGKPNPSVRYLLNMSGLNVQLRATGFSYDTWVTVGGQQSAIGSSSLMSAPGLPTNSGLKTKYHRVDIELEGANPQARLVASRPIAAPLNVISDRGSFESIRSFQSVTYRDIYPGIDLEFVAKKGTDKPVEYNFIVHPGADASQIKMKYNSGSEISLKNGMIEMDLAFGKLKEKIPASYTQQDGRSLAVQYKPLDEAANVYAFNVPGYDSRKTLVIDPTPSLVWSTYYGGTGIESIQAIDVDDAGNIYAGGVTNGNNAIATAGTYQSVFGGSNDMFVAKFTSAGVRLWATYYGGASNESLYNLKASGTSVYIAGNTPNAGLASAAAYQTAVSGISDVIIAKLDGANGTRVWATYFGGPAASGIESANSLTVDAAGNIYFGGTTQSTSGIATAGSYKTTISGTEDGYVAKFNSSGAIQWATYIGGPSVSDQVFGLAVDASGNVYASGYTQSTSGIATAGSFQPAIIGTGTTSDIYLTKLNSTGTTRLWATYWGGDGNDINRGVQIGPDGNLIVGGFTGSIAAIGVSNGVATPGAYQTAPAGERDLIFGKFTPDGDRLWATYYGGDSSEFMVNGFALDETGNILFGADGFASITNTAVSASPGLSTNCSFQPDQMGANEVFVGKLSADGTTRLWGSYFGTAAIERCYAFAYAGNGNFLIGGFSQGTTLATAGAHQTVKSTGDDAFLARFTEGFAPSDVKVTTTTLAPMTQTACALGIPATITGNAVSLYNPPGFASPIFYQWQSASSATGPWTNISGEVFKDLQPLASQTTRYYRRLILVNNGYCDTKAVDSSAVASVTINGNVAPIANANGPQWYVCGAGFNTVTLNGSATGGSGVYSSYQWYAGSNLTTPAATTATYTPTVTATTTYTLKVTDNAGCIDVDQVTIVPATANAGPDVSMCENSGGIQIGTPGTPGGAVTYSWTPATGLSCTNCAQPIASPATTTNYQLTTTVTRKDGTTCSTTDNVTVTFVAAPTGGATFAGTDKTICKNSSVMLGGVNDALATYSWSPTSYLDASNIYNPTFNAGTNNVACPMVYTVTAAKGGCSFTDQVNVSVVDPSTSLDNQTLTCGGWASGNTNNCSGATYSWQLISGPGVVPTGASLSGGGANGYLVNTGASNAVYRRVTTVNGVPCTSADITITPCGGGGGGCPLLTIQPMTPQGCPKVFGQQDLQLRVSGINPADYTFSWTPANIMDNPVAAIVTITSTAATTVNVTVTNKYTGQVCPVPGLAINNPSWSLPVLSTPDKSICPGTPSVAIGEPTAAGFTYAWSPATGLSSASISNPVATLTSAATYLVTKTDNSNGCKTSDEVKVTIANIDFDAGPSHAVCNGATVTLGTTPGGSYTYSWTPAGAAWTNGTGPTNANPQVLFASTTQTFNVTVTDPATGCQKIDAVTLSGTTTPGEYAGVNIGPLCPGETGQLGTAAVPNASYSWSPATGLSCTTCANPTVTAGTSNQVYTVTVSYPGCSTPVTDNVTVSVNSLPAVTLTDKTVCPTTPTNIGIGGTGNTASLANVKSYDWTPATNLSCTNCASPNANPVIATTYHVLITFTNGCTISRSVTVTPAVTATAKPDATICPGGSVVLGSPAVPNVTYAWAVLSGTGGSVNPANVAQPVANPTVTSVYRLTATGTGPNAGCTVTDDVTITVKALPAFNINGNTAVCTGGATTLSVSPVTTNVIYQWSPTTGLGTPNSATTTAMPAASTTYRVTQTDINSGCSDYKEVVVTVWPNNVTAIGGSIQVCPSSSATMPLTVTPVSGTTVAWSPATNLSNAYTQHPIVTPMASGQYIATVTDNTTSCSDTALVTVIVPASCLAYDFGDAPAVYENGNPARHGILSTLKIGAATDAEGAPVSAAPNTPATGDDGNNAINDEEGISFLPTPNTASQTLGLVVSNVLNNTGKTAYLAAWIDFNLDGDFNDAGERSQVLPLAANAVAADPVVQFNNFNTGCAVGAGLSYLRIRLTTDTSGGWAANPSPAGIRTDGEVEDYAITIMGSDFGDAPVVYPVARALVNPDRNNDGKPDSTGSVWLGNIVDYIGCNYAASAQANADDLNGLSDEDGLNMGAYMPPNTTINWQVTVNSQGPVNGVQWGMWIDWNADGTFDGFYNGSVNTASPVTVPVSVTSPANSTSNYIVRLGVRTGAAFTAADYTAPITNGEWEDYIAAPNPLSLGLVAFTATKVNSTGLLQWTINTAGEKEYFLVERSNDSKRWEEIGRVNAMPAMGSADYELTDRRPLQGRNFYRLRIISTDGSYKISPIRQLVFGKDISMITIVPNPVQDIATVIFNEPVQEPLTMKLINSFGQLVNAYEVPAGTIRYPLSLGIVPKGMYYLDVTGNTVQGHLKLIVQ